MLETVLIPLDGSALAERALPLAQQLANAAKGRLRLLWVVPSETGGASGARAEEADKAEAIHYLQKVADRLAPANVDLEVRAGDPATEILACLAESKADLVVMSTHGRSGLGRWIYGSVADQVMREAPVPVVLVSATCAMRPWPTEHPPRVLVSLDYSELSEAVLSAVRELAATIGAEIILLSVTPLLVTADPTGMAYVGYDLDADLADRKQYLEGVAARLREAGFTVTCRSTLGFVDSEILQAAQEEDATLIALSTHGSGGVTRVLMGSVATGIVQRATTPVLIVRPAEVRASEGAHLPAK
jgi:nucleotide-binding universal stress UspA family protein